MQKKNDKIVENTKIKIIQQQSENTNFIQNEYIHERSWIPQENKEYDSKIGTIYEIVEQKHIQPAIDQHNSNRQALEFFNDNLTPRSL